MPFLLGFNLKIVIYWWGRLTFGGREIKIWLGESTGGNLFRWRGGRGGWANCYHFLDIYENSKRKNFINLTCSKHSKSIKIKNDKILFSHFFGVPFLFEVSSFGSTKKKCENKKLTSFPPLFSGLGQGLIKTVFVKLLTYAIFVSLMI